MLENSFEFVVQVFRPVRFRPVSGIPDLDPLRCRTHSLRSLNAMGTRKKVRTKPGITGAVGDRHTEGRLGGGGETEQTSHHRGGGGKKNTRVLVKGGGGI